jgi:WhiB family redox-sensing transcriptional regulator
MRVPIEFENPSCSQISTELFFPERGEDRILISQVKSVCTRCPHQQECAEWGIINEGHGIWGGLTPEDRRLIRRQRGITLEERTVA